MVSLQNFSQTFANPECTLSSGSRLCGVPRSEVVSGNAAVTEFYPVIDLSRDQIDSFGYGNQYDAVNSVLVSVEEPCLKRIIRTFFESGWNEAFEEARNDKTSMEQPTIKIVADMVHKILDVLNQGKTKCFPNLKQRGKSEISIYSETRDWQSSRVRYIAWHPNCFKIAVAGCDDSVRVCSDQHESPIILKTQMQKLITSLAWRPYAISELAVACESGICVWSSEGHFHRQMGVSTFLKYPNHSPVTSVEWNSDGSLLASASFNQTDILIWNVDKGTNCALKRVGLASSLLKWAPDGVSLLSSTVGSVFRVWSAENNWTPDRWTTASGFIQSAAWSPCSSFLLFVTSSDSVLYQLQFEEEQIYKDGTSSKQALPLADLEKVLINGKEIGGLPQSIAWDPNGRYLAVIYKDSPNITVFTTSVTKYNLNISPACYLSGQSLMEHPTFITFQTKNSRNPSHSILTIGWSSGRVQYFPFF